nr:chitobiase/beta-hexosaminidase C-terminal domain-containing protein [Lachnospiraceae bacterium]
MGMKRVIKRGIALLTVAGMILMDGVKVSADVLITDDCAIIEGPEISGEQSVEIKDVSAGDIILSDGGIIDEEISVNDTFTGETDQVILISDNEIAADREDKKDYLCVSENKIGEDISISEEGIAEDMTLSENNINEDVSISENNINENLSISENSVNDISNDKAAGPDALSNSYKVTFNIGERTGIAVPDPITVVFGDVYGELPNPGSTAELAFVGWYLEEECTNKVTKDTIVKTSEDHTLYAGWFSNSKIDSPLISTENNKKELMEGDIISLSCSLPGAEIYYTTDGSIPDEKSDKYTEPVKAFIADKREVYDFTIKAVAVKEGYINSEVAEALFRITPE